MENKYLQKRFGECAYVCIANIFDREDIIRNAKDLDKGLSWIDTRRLIETETEFAIHTLLYSPKAIKKYIPVFEVDNDFGTVKDLYVVFLASIPSGINEFRHSILIIKENFNPTLTILDPKYRSCKKVHIKNIFKEYDLFEIETLCDKEHGGTMFFDESYLKHLFKK